MNTSLAKKPSSFMREQTRPVRDHASAMARLTDQYVAALKRAEAQYFEGVRRITDAITGETGGEEVVSTPSTTDVPSQATDQPIQS